MKNKGFQISWWLILTVFCLIIGVSLSAEIIIKNTGISFNVLEFLTQFVMLIPIIAGIIILKLIHPYDTVKNMLGIKGFDATMLLFFIVMPLSAQYFASFITAPASFALTKVFGEYNPGIMAPDNLSELISLFFTACIAAPVMEEIMFRGIIMKLLSPYGFLTAAIVSSVGFAMLHMSPTGFFVILFLGFVLASIRYISGSVVACMVFHMFNNFYSIIQLVFEKQIMTLESEMILFVGILALIFPVIFLLYKKIYPKEEAYTVTVKRLGFSVGLLLCILIFLAYSVFLMANNMQFLK